MQPSAASRLRPPNAQDLVRAIASYERTQLSLDSPFDHFIAVAVTLLLPRGSDLTCPMRSGRIGARREGHSSKLCQNLILGRPDGPGCCAEWNSVQPGGIASELDSHQLHSFRLRLRRRVAGRGFSLDVAREASQ